MAVGADDAQILRSIVIPPTVHMIELKRNGLAIPSIKAADFTMWLLDTLFDKSPLQITGLHELAGD